jgi:D-alanine-D-alanine ligase
MLVDWETGERDRTSCFVPDRSSMEEKVWVALRASFPRVVVVPCGPDIVDTITELRSLKPRLVFNLTEWIAGDRSLDHAIAGLLDILKLRYTGTGRIGLQLCRDKALAKRIVAEAGVEVPRPYTPNHAVTDGALPFPLIVKPRHGDASDGIVKASLVRTGRELRRRASALRARFDDLVFEEFIPGRDLYVGILGNEPRVLAPTEMVIESRSAAAPKFATYQVKNSGAYRTRWRVRYRLAELSAPIRRMINDYSVRAFRALSLRDYARLDFRLTDEGRLVFIEANPNPDLTPHTLGRNLCFVGVEYEKLIPRIARIALRRYRVRT